MARKFGGYVRQLDKLHRFVVPVDVCEHFGWVDGTPLEVGVTEDGIILRRYVQDHSCVFCGRVTAATVLDKPVCTTCRAAVRHD